MRSSGFLSLFPLCQAATTSRELVFFSSKFFKTPFEKFCPSVPWDSPVRHFWVTFAFLDFRVELRFQGRFLTVEPGSRLSGYPAGGRSILITSHQMLPYKTGFDSIFDLGGVCWASSAGRPLQRDTCHTHSESSVEPSLGEVLGFDSHSLAP